MSMTHSTLTYPTLGHVFSSIRAIAPSDDIHQRLSSLEALLFYKTNEEQIQDQINLSNFGELIHATPFKSSVKRTSVPSIPSTPRVPRTQVIQKVLPTEIDYHPEGQSIQNSRDSISLHSKKLTNTKSLNDGKTQKKQGILKKGDKSRFAKLERGSSAQSDANTSKVTIVEKE